MDWILVDWTRMGRTYCLAGAVLQDGQARIVRPLLARYADAPVRNVGWSPFQMDGHQRFEVFELVGPVAAPPQPPHLEDVRVRSLHPRGRLATPAERRAILQATLVPSGTEPFGAPWKLTQSSAHLEPGTGVRSLTSIVVSADQLAFTANWRSGIAEPDVRVRIDGAGLAGRTLPVKDHLLLSRSEKAGPDLQTQLGALTAAVKEMGATVLVRLGLSRAFQGTEKRGPGQCWLMADGFFSLVDPQP